MPPVVAIIAGIAAVAGGIAGGVTITAFSLSLWMSASFLFGIGTTLVLSGVSRMLQKTPNFGGGGSGSSLLHEAQSRTITARQAAAARRIIYGAPRIGGVITYLGKRGTNGEYLDIVVTLSGCELNQIGDMYFDDVVVALDGSGNGTGKYAGFVHVEKNLGTDSQTAFAGLVANAPTKWTTNHRQRGCAGVYIWLKFDPDIWPNGIPNITFDVQGRKVYDPRTGLTVYSTNAALCLADYMTFPAAKGGCGIPYSKFDESRLIAAANTCDEDVPLAAGGTEKRYAITGLFETTATPIDMIPKMLGAMAGTMPYIGGKWQMYEGAWRTPSIQVSENDLRDSMKVRTRLSKREIFNGVKGLYISAANKWQAADFPAVPGSSYLVEDGNERIWQDIELPFTISPARAQRLAKINLEVARRQITVELACKLSAYTIQPPDVIYLSNSRFGWSNKTFEVTGSKLSVDEDGALGVDLTLRETDANVYAWGTGEELVANTLPTPDLPTFANPDQQIPDAVGAAMSRDNDLPNSSFYVAGVAGQEGTDQPKYWSRYSQAGGSPTSADVEWQSANDRVALHTKTSTVDKLGLRSLLKNWGRLYKQGEWLTFAVCVWHNGASGTYNKDVKVQLDNDARTYLDPNSQPYLLTIPAGTITTTPSIHFKAIQLNPNIAVPDTLNLFVWSEATNASKSNEDLNLDWVTCRRGSRPANWSPGTVSENDIVWDAVSRYSLPTWLVKATASTSSVGSETTATGGRPDYGFYNRYSPYY